MLVYQRVNPSKPNGSHICPHTEAHGTVMEKISCFRRGTHPNWRSFFSQPQSILRLGKESWYNGITYNFPHNLMGEYMAMDQYL